MTVLFSLLLAMSLLAGCATTTTEPSGVSKISVGAFNQNILGQKEELTKCYNEAKNVPINLQFKIVNKKIVVVKKDGPEDITTCINVVLNRVTFDVGATIHQGTTTLVLSNNSLEVLNSNLNPAPEGYFRSGGVAPTDIRDGSKIQACYTKLSKVSSSGKIRLKIHYKVDGSGTVLVPIKLVFDSAKAGKDSTLASCIKSIVKGWRYPRSSTGETSTMTHEYTFNPPK